MTDDEVRVAEMLREILQGWRRRLHDFKNYHATTLPDDAPRKMLLDTIERLESEIAEHLSRLTFGGRAPRDGGEVVRGTRVQ